MESKIVSTKESTILNQLKKYKQILENRRLEYSKIRLVYVGKNSITKKEFNYLKKKLKLKKDEFFFFSWEDLLNLTMPFKQKEFIKLFNDFIGDSMHNKKSIWEQQIKNIVEVLCVFTNQDFWELTEKKNIAVQGVSAPDAQYMAFLRTHRGKGVKSAITHIARVSSTEIVSIGESYSNMPKLLRGVKEKKYNLNQDMHKRYNLEKVEKLPCEIIHDCNKGQVKFKTRFSELLRAKSTKDIHTLK
ncbi:MAG: hypothetical protein AAB851_03195 [Patescibacteria group bacterium]